MSGSLVTFSSTNKAGDGRAILFRGTPSQPAVIVLHEWWGMNEQIQQEGEMISREGQLTVLVPDLYRGKVATDNETAGHLMHGLDWPGALEDIQAAAAYLKSLGHSKIGILGFCMGGALSLASAVNCSNISASAPFYGIPNAQLADVSKCKVPLQLHFGEKDDIVGFSSLADYNLLVEKLKNAGVSYEGYLYAAGHGFTNPNNPNYNAEFTKQAFERVYKFMHANLA